MNNTKKLVFEKIVCKQEMKETVISQWMKPKGYDFVMTSLELNVFNATAHLIFGKYDEFKKFAKDKHNFDTEYKSCTAMVVHIEDNGVQWHYILIQENDWTADHYNTIVHELHHLTHFLLDGKGVSYGIGGEEVFAYVQGYFMELVVRAFVMLKKKKKA